MNPLLEYLDRLRNADPLFYQQAIDTATNQAKIGIVFWSIIFILAISFMLYFYQECIKDKESLIKPIIYTFIIIAFFTLMIMNNIEVINNPIYRATELLINDIK